MYTTPTTTAKNRSKKEFNVDKVARANRRNSRSSLSGKDNYIQLRAIEPLMNVSVPDFKRPMKRGSVSSDAPYSRDDLPFKKKKAGSKTEFSCDLCSIQCSSQVTLDSHLMGKKHKKFVQILNEQMLTDAALPAASGKRSPVVADIQEGFDELSKFEPVLGLEYVTEYQAPDTNHRYFCELCGLKTNSDGMLEHVICRQHRLRFMRTHNFDVYCKVTGYPTFKDMMQPSKADKFLRQHSGLLFCQSLDSKLRSCKVKSYKSEEYMKADLQSLKAHQSRHDDLEIAEELLQEEERKQQAELTMRQNLDFERLNRTNSHSLQLDNALHNMSAGLKLSNFSEPTLNEDLISDLLEIERLEDELAMSKLWEKRLVDLNQQERRIVAAIKKLRQSVSGAEMTGEEAVACDRLLMLLKGICAEKRHILSVKNRSRVRDEQYTQPTSYGDRLSLSDEPSTSSVVNQCGKLSGMDEKVVEGSMREVFRGPQNSPETTHLVTNDPTVNHREFKSVEPIIEETRQKVEEKIFEALNSGTLSSLLENFQRNPELQASLKEWGSQHSVKSRDMPYLSRQSLTKDIPSTSSSTAEVQSTRSDSGNQLAHYSSAGSVGVAEKSYMCNNNHRHPYEHSLHDTDERGQLIRSEHLNNINNSKTSVSSKPKAQDNHRKSEVSPGILGSRPQFSGGSMKFRPGFF